MDPGLRRDDAEFGARSRDDVGVVVGRCATHGVIPAQAGIQFCFASSEVVEGRRIPAFAG